MELHKSQVTDIQKGLYYIQKIQPDTSAYNIVFSMKIQGKINVERLDKAFKHVQAQHIALRQIFTENDGVVQATEAPDLLLNIVQHDILHLVPEIQKQHIIITSKKSFQLDKEICLRVDLFRTSDNEQVLLLTAHHASFDFWSLALLLEQVEQACLDLHAGKKLTLDQDILQFDQYTNEVAVNQKSEKYQEMKEKVVTGLSGHPGTLDLSTDKPRPKIQSYQGQSYSFSIPANISARIMASAKTANVTPYMYLLCIYQVLLHRYTGQDDILVGSPISGREKRKYRNIIGNFVNTIVLRSQSHGEMTFSERLQQTAKSVVSAIRHQTVAFPQVVEALTLKRDPSRTPLIQANFSWDRFPQLAKFSHFFSHSDDQSSVDWAGLTITPYWIPQQEGQFDIALEMGAEVQGELTATIKYCDDLFLESSITCFAKNFVQLLASFSQHHEQNIYAVKLVDKEQARHLIGLAHSSINLTRPRKTIHAEISQQAELTPDAIALQDETRSLSYKDLDILTSRLAQQMAARYNIFGQPVGICMPRSVDLVVYLIAIMKAGACYVPVDPSTPEDRSTMIIEDSKLTLLLMDPDIQHLDFSSIVDTLNTQLFLKATQSSDVILKTKLPEVSAEKTAYVLFTSGSTGRPKGVSVPHRCVTNLLHSFAKYPGFSSGDKLLSLTTITFDISVLELFLPLTQGGTTIIVDSAVSADPTVLMENIKRFQPSLMQATPATWKMLFEAGWEGDQALTILCGGEALPSALAERLTHCSYRLFNVYGPTETTIWSTISHYKDGNVTIGHPIANTQIFVLDQNLQLVPQGVVGEIHIAGHGVSDGYINRQELTNKVFLSNPYGPGKIYKTGDLGRLNSHGEFECLGRLGNQVKIRGYRIELDDIEENLRKISGIRDVVVQAKNIHDDLSLVCYFVNQADKNVSATNIKKHLKSVLPAYMVPAFYMNLDALPLTENGKIDRKSLPTPDVALQQRTILSAQNITESKILSIWKTVLNQDHISTDDDFYDIGGHSLLAAQLTNKIGSAFNVELGHQFILTNTTIQEMAKAITQKNTGMDNTCAIKLHEGSKNHRPLFLMHPIGGTVHCYMALKQTMDKKLPVYAFQSPGIDDVDEVEVGIESIVEKYVAEILTIQPEGPYTLGGWCFGGVLAYEAAAQLKAMNKRVTGIHIFDTRAPIIANHPDDGDDATLLSWFARDLAVPHNKILNILPDELRAIDADEQFTYVLDRAQAIGVIDSDIAAEKLMNYFQVYIANGMALQMYEEKFVDINVTLYRAKNEPVDYGEFLGWDKLLNTSDHKCHFTVIDIEGDHNSIMYKPQASQLGRALNKSLLAATFSTTAQKEECLA